MSPTIVCLIIFVLSLVLYASNKLPMGVTSILAILALMFTGCIDGKAALAQFSNSNAILVASMFIMSSCIGKTSYIDKFSRFVIKITGGTFRGAWLGYTILVLILTNLLTSPMVVFAILFPLCANMCDEFGVGRSKVMYPLIVLALVCCTILPTGYSITAVGQKNGYFEQFGFTGVSIDFVDFTKARWPVFIIAFLWANFYVLKVAPEKPIIPIEDTKKSGEKKQLSRFSDIAGVVIFAVVVLMMLFNAKTGIAPWKVAMAGAVLSVVCGVMNKKEAIDAMNVDIVLMLVGALTMANALSATGAGELVGNWLSTIVGGTHNSYVLGALFYIIPFLVTQFMMNQAVMNIFYPIGILTCQALGANPVGICILITAACLSSFLTPLATPGVAMCMGIGGYDIKSLGKMGWLLSIVLAVVQVVFVMTIFPAF